TTDHVITPWRPIFSSYTTPSNEASEQSLQTQRRLAMQQVRVARLSPAEVDITLPATDLDALESTNRLEGEYPRGRQKSLRHQQGHAASANSTSTTSEGAGWRLRSLSPSKILSRRKGSCLKGRAPDAASTGAQGQDRTEAKLSIDSKLANRTRVSPLKFAKTEANEREPLTAAASLRPRVSPTHSPRTPAFNGNCAVTGQPGGSAFRSVSTPHRDIFNLKTMLHDVAERDTPLATSSPKRDGQADALAVKTPKSSGLKGWGSKIVRSNKKTLAPHIPTNPFQSRLSPHGANCATVSLDPPTQARLYADLDLMICVSANQFLVQQHRARRISVDVFAKLLSNWMIRNRPPVPQFMFDQSTQRELIEAHTRVFKFHGECARSMLSLTTTLGAWRSFAEELSMRTYFMPDSTVRKHLNDALKVLEMLGATAGTFLSFQKARLKALRIMEGAQERKSKEEPSGRDL
ncbi:hypothetical protein KEM55_002155, partial [Ascosphaera atra]